MKISYIILPFENPEYFIRCVNSLYRQIGSDYEVILAENDFGKDSDELNLFLDEKRQLIRISWDAKSREEKLAEAVRLIPADSGYVILVDVNTVVTPIAAQAVLSCGNPDIIIPAIAVRDGKRFLLDDLDETALIEKIEQCTPDRICFGRKVFVEFCEKILLNDEKNFHYWILEKFSENLDIGCTKDVCMYIEKISEKKVYEIETGQWKIVMAKVVDNFENIGSLKLKLGLLNKYATYFMQIMGRDTEDAASIFVEFQNLCGKCMDSPLLNKLVWQRVGFQSEDFLCLSWEEYRLFLNLSQGKDGFFVLLGNSAMQNERLYKMEKNLEGLMCELASIKMEYAAPSIGQVIAEPIRDIPRMYREGRLGLRTILGSFMGWLGYKLSRKK